MTDLQLGPRQRAVLCNLADPEAPSSSKPEWRTSSRTAQTTG